MEKAVGAGSGKAFVHFSCGKVLEFGDSLYVCGNHEKMGAWDLSKSVRLDFNLAVTCWSGVIELPAPGKYEYKFLVDKTDKVPTKPLWFPDPNVKLSLSAKAIHSPLRVMSFNIRYLNKHDGVSHWENRKEAVIKLLQAQNCNIFGLQEATLAQQEELCKRLSAEYDCVYQVRDNDKGEGCPIYYKKDMWICKSSGTFWLSDTPDKPVSTTFGNTIPRIVTWARLCRKETSTSLLVLNTHYDHLKSDIREKSSKKILQKLPTLAPGCENTIFMGDFNALPSDPEIKIITDCGYLADTFDSYKEYPESKNDCATFHNWTGSLYGEKIDYIFTSKNIKCEDCIIYRETIDTEKKLYPSDHYPIIATLNVI